MRYNRIAGAAIVLACLAGAGPETPKQTKPATPAATPAAAPTTTPAADPGPAAVVRTYLGFLGSGHPCQAIEQCFDTDAFAKRVFKDDLNKLDASEAAYMSHLSSVFVQVAVSLVGQPKIEPAELKTTGGGNEVTVTCKMSIDQGPTREVGMLTCRTAAGWKIVDIDTMSTVATNGYARFKPTGMSPVFFMESMLGGLIRNKLEHLGEHAPAHVTQQDAQKAHIQIQLTTLQNQLELYKARNDHYPDLVANGWKDLLKGGYLRKAPVNPLNGHSEVCAGLTGKANTGWHWDAKSGTLGACYFDEEKEELTPETP